MFATQPSRRTVPRSLVWLAAAALIAGAAAGCGGRKTYPLQGRVVYAPDNAPATDLAGYEVTAVGGEPAATAVGTIDKDGHFKLSTFGDADGAVAGEYRVAITPPVAEGDEIAGPARIDVRYQDLSKSELSFQVPLESDEGAVLVVERRKQEQ